MNWDEIRQYLQSLEWHRLIPELVGKAAGFLLGFAASWFLLFRRRLKEIQRFQQGDSDDIIFQFHKLVPLEDGQVALLFRNIGPKTTVNKLYDNPAARDLFKSLADKTSLADPVLATESTGGFEVLNDCFSQLAGHLALTPFPREIWLFAMTCEDRQIVRKKCVRCFLIRPDDLAKFEDWQWCCTMVRVERTWHWFRVVALHRIALVRRAEQEQTKREAEAGKSGGMPLVDKQTRHNRIKEMSAGVNTEEKLVNVPVKIAWAKHLAELTQMGMSLEPPRDAGE